MSVDSLWGPAAKQKDLWSKGKSTNIFVGTVKGGSMKSFYKWNGRSDDLVIETLKRLGKLN